MNNKQALDSGRIILLLLNTKGSERQALFRVHGAQQRCVSVLVKQRLSISAFCAQQQRNLMPDCNGDLLYLNDILIRLGVHYQYFLVCKSVFQKTLSSRNDQKNCNDQVLNDLLCLHDIPIRSGTKYQFFLDCKCIFHKDLSEWLRQHPVKKWL